MNLDDLTIGQARELARLFGQNAPQAACVPPASAVHAERPVIVTTDKRGVVFGYTDDVSARPITLRRARMCLYWSRDVGGVFGLAEKGPSKDSKVSAPLPEIVMEGVTAIMSVDDAAVKAWTGAAVAGR